MIAPQGIFLPFLVAVQPGEIHNVEYNKKCVRIQMKRIQWLTQKKGTASNIILP
jgi:hypothetical protein